MTRKSLQEVNKSRTRWRMFHFSVANPVGRGQDDVARLLRRLAKSVKELGPMEVHDITFHAEVTAEGIRPTMTVYYSLHEASRGQ